MLTNYLKIAWRNLLINKTPSIINLVGLSIAIASAVTVFLILKNFWTLDDFHLKGDRIFMLEYITEQKGERVVHGNGIAPMAELLAHHPQVKQTVRVAQEGVSVYRKETVFDELLTYADTNYLNLFTFPLRYGDPSALRDPSALILSYETAEKYFPNQNPIGQQFTLMTAEREQKAFVIRGVAAKFPDNAGFRFELLTGFHPIHKALQNVNWRLPIRALFVELNASTAAPALTTQLARYVPLYNAKNPEQPIQSFVLDNLHHPAPKAYEVQHRPAEANHPLTTVLFSAMALVMMILSCVNYVNISLGGVTRRFKEIGVRKVLGSSRRQIIAQFMVENLLLCLLALVAGLLLTTVFLIPLFNSIMVMSLSLNFTQNPSLWLFLGGILLLTALASGAYPSFYLSALRPIVVFTRQWAGDGKSLLNRAMLTIQFALAFVAVILGVVVSSTGFAWERVDWGYDPTRTMVIRLTDSTQFAILKNELAQHPAILAMAGAGNHVGESANWQQIRTGAESATALRYNVSAEYARTLGLPLASGRFFSPDRPAENQQSIVINESLAERLGWRGKAEGRTIHIGQQPYQVLGVVNDVKLVGSGAPRPALFLTTDVPQFNYLIAQFAPGYGPQLEAAIEAMSRQQLGRAPLTHFYQVDVFDSFNTTFQNVAHSFGWVAGLALLIACLGLYGLAAQHFARRLKEVSIRKTLGAPVGQLMLLVNRQFIGLLVVAGLIANVLCYVGVTVTLQQTRDFTGTYQPGIGPYLLANLLVFITAVIAVASQTWQVTHVRLAESLRNSN